MSGSSPERAGCASLFVRKGGTFLHDPCNKTNFNSYTATGWFCQALMFMRRL